MDDNFSFRSVLPENIASLDMESFLTAAIVGIIIFFLVVAARSVIAYYRSASNVAYALARAKKKAERRNRILLAVYQTVSKVPGARKYLKMVEHAYINICPYDDAVLARLTSETVTIAFLVSSVGMIAVLSMNLVLERTVSFYSVACAGLAVYILSVETLHIRIRAKEKKLTEDLIHYFATVKHVYLACKSIPRAVIEAADGMSYEVNMHAMQVHGILTGTDRKEKVREYALDPRTNPYMKLFISQVYQASERGDTIRKDSDASLLTGNLEFLRVEMIRDAGRKENKDYKFQGYSLVTCLPVFFMALLRIWGMDFSAEMVDFHAGGGYLVMVLAFFATVLVYDNVNKAKEVNLVRVSRDTDFFDRISQKNVIRRYMELVEITHSDGLEKIRSMLKETNTNKTLGAFVVRMTMYVIVGTIIGAVFFSSFHFQRKEHLLTEVNNIDNIVYIASEKQKQVISGHILDMTREYLHAEDLSIDILAYDFQGRMFLPNQESVTNICKEVQRRVSAYHEEYFRWYEFVLSLLFGVASGFIPYVSLQYKYGIIQAGKNDEIRQFQSIIIMERAFPDVTSQQILEEMETFAVVFKKSIRKCLNCYSAGPREALLELRDSEKDCNEFMEIVDGFLAVETVGVAKAFAEVQNNRERSESTRMLYEDIYLRKKTDFTDMISMIPAVIVVGGYFIGPFCYYVFGSVLDMFDMLETFNNF